MRRVRAGYSDTELYLHLVRANCGIVVGGDINNEMSALLHQDFNKMPVASRSKKLRQNQGFAYSGTQGAYIDLWD